MGEKVWKAVWGFTVVLFLVRAIVIIFESASTTYPYSLWTTMTWSSTLLAGMFLLYCQHYRFKWSEEGRLVTTGPYRIARHPIYQAFYLFDLTLFPRADLQSWLFWATWVVFTVGIYTLCRLEEHVVLTKWGEDGKRYYARTPRFLFEWLWFWKVRTSPN